MEHLIYYVISECLTAPQIYSRSLLLVKVSNPGRDMPQWPTEPLQVGVTALAIGTLNDKEYEIAAANMQLEAKAGGLCPL